MLNNYKMIIAGSDNNPHIYGYHQTTTDNQELVMGCAGNFQPGIGSGDLSLLELLPKFNVCISKEKDFLVVLWCFACWLQLHEKNLQAP